jgi:hypothetical protein
MRSVVYKCVVILAMACSAFGWSNAASAQSLNGRKESGIDGTGLTCAWPFPVNADTLARNRALNIHNPDTDADYWVMAFTVKQDLQITLNGHFPKARYMSIEVYSSEGTAFEDDNVSSSLTDFEISANKGSINPWQRRGTGNGTFTVSLRTPVTSGASNVLPLAPAGTPDGDVGLLFFRVYGPNGSPADVALPGVTVTDAGSTRHLSACHSETSTSSSAAHVLEALGLGSGSGIASNPASKLTLDPGQLIPFALGSAVLGSTPNTDTRYLSAYYFPPKKGDVLVIQGKAPITPGGSSPAPWPAQGTAMRYWSICNDLLAAPQPVVVNHLSGGQVDYGCRDDSQVVLDRQGYYTMILGTESERAAIDRIPGATFLPFNQADPEQAYKINLRNMLPNPSFTKAVQRVPPNDSPASAAAVMGPYYPRTALCSLQALRTAGVAKCLATAG